MQQMAAERFSLLHKQGWPFMCGYSLAELHTGMHVLVGFSAQNVNKHNNNTFEAHALQSNNQTSAYARCRKWSILYNYNDLTCVLKKWPWRGSSQGLLLSPISISQPQHFHNNMQDAKVLPITCKIGSRYIINIPLEITIKPKFFPLSQTP